MLYKKKQLRIAGNLGEDTRERCYVFTTAPTHAALPSFKQHKNKKQKLKTQVPERHILSSIFQHKLNLAPQKSVLPPKTSCLRKICTGILEEARKWLGYSSPKLF